MKKWSLPLLLTFLLLVLFACSEPSLKDVSFTGLTTTGTGNDTISLSWTTDTAADCTVHYGPYSFYGLSASATPDADKLTHSVELTGLRPHTNYHYKISANPESADYQNTETEDNEANTTLSSTNATNVTDSEWEAVGALCFSDADGFYGPFCTGVLIADDVVLTAAHCLDVEADYYGRVPSAANVVFYVGGNDASPTDGGGAPVSGMVYGVEDIVVHQDYDFTTDPEANDLALVHLSERVSGVTPVDYNSTALTGAAGEDFTIAGFDASYLGVKKVSYFTIDTLYGDTFTDDGTSTNLGSGGIPAFMEISGTLKVIGISTSVNTEPFDGPATYNRVDYYSPWIADKIVGFSNP